MVDDTPCAMSYLGEIKLREQWRCCSLELDPIFQQSCCPDQQTKCANPLLVRNLNSQKLCKGTERELCLQVTEGKIFVQ